jgi:hypothetical protein
MPSTPTNTVPRLLPLLLAVSLTACATRSPSVVTPPATPKAPAELMEPESANYSQRVEQLLRTWAETLTGSPTR